MPEALEPLFSGVCLHRLFENQLEKTPDAIALLYKEQRLTFSETNARANRFAHHLRRLGVGPEILVGFCLARDPDAVVCALAILKAGGSYVALDPNYPCARLKQMVDEARLTLIVTSTDLSPLIPESVPSVLRLEEDSAVIALEQCDNPRSAVGPDNAASVIFTSGSTGRPKGVVRVHRGLMSSVPWAAFENDEMCGLNLSLSVGYSLHRLFLPLVSGVPVTLIPETVARDPNLLTREFEANGVTNAAFVPSSLRELLNQGPELSSRLRDLRTVTVGGANLPKDLVELFTKKLPHAILFNQYAASETGPVAVSKVTARETADPVFIGQPVPGTQVYLFDGNTRPCETGKTGELYVAGRHFARGYLNNESLTVERFVYVQGERMYRTGDLGRYTSSGEIEIVGRRDRQVKIRGFRVELEDVEAVLRIHETLQEAVVVVEESNGENRLVAYVITKPEATPTVQQLREWVGQRLPKYMLPAAFFSHGKLASYTNGKN